MSDVALAFAEALAAFQAEMPHVAKGQTAKAGSFTYSYADLTDITQAAVPLLSKHGLSWTARPTLSDAGVFVLRYSLLHTAGHREDGDYPLPDPSRSSPQEIGSALTYARRYALCAVTGIAPGGDDDDGQKASEARSSDVTRAPQRARRSGPPADPSTAPDEWATAAPKESERVTDQAWVERFRTRLTACTKPSEVRGLDAEAHVQYGEGNLTADDAKMLKGEIDARMQELSGTLV